VLKKRFQCWRNAILHSCHTFVSILVQLYNIEYLPLLVILTLYDH